MTLELDPENTSIESSTATHGLIRALNQAPESLSSHDAEISSIEVMRLKVRRLILFLSIPFDIAYNSCL